MDEDTRAIFQLMVERGMIDGEKIFMVNEIFKQLTNKINVFMTLGTHVAAIFNDAAVVAITQIITPLLRLFRNHSKCTQACPVCCVRESVKERQIDDIEAEDDVPNFLGPGRKRNQVLQLLTDVRLERRGKKRKLETIITEGAVLQP